METGINDINQDRRIIRARSHLLMDFPLWGQTVLSLPLVERSAVKGKKIKTMATDGRFIYYNPEYLAELDHAGLMAELAHESAHVWLLHHTRRGGRDLQTWNEAADYAINPLLWEAGFNLPAGWLLDPDMSSSAEGNYKILMDRKKKEQEQDQEQDQAADQDQEQGAGQDQGGQDASNSGQDLDGETDQGADAGGAGGAGGDIDQDPDIDFGPGGVMDYPGPDPSVEENRVKVQIVQSLQAAKTAGKVPGDMARALEGTLSPVISWVDAVGDWVTGRFPDDYSYSRPSNRSTGGYILPGLCADTMGKLVIAIDTSGSVFYHLETLELFQGAIRSLQDQYRFESVVVCCDAEVQGIPVEFSRGQEIELVPVGGGGTAFGPAFDWVADNLAGQDIAGLIYFTDLICWDYPAMDPGFPVLWAVYGGDPGDYYQKRVPFGEILLIGD